MNNTTLTIILGLAILGSVGTYMLSTHNASDSKLASHHDHPEAQLRMQLFRDWTSEYKKQYSATESPQRFRVWNENYDIVQQHNAKNLSWTLAMNQFADLSHEEFSALHLGFRPELHTEGDENLKILDTTNLSASIDWKTKGAVTSVKNQASCGACYAFAAAAGLEGAYKIKKGTLVDLSFQQILDCSSSYGNNGCNGGLMTYSYSYTKAYGIEKLSDYAWAGTKQTCKYSSSKALFKNTGYTTVSASATQLLAAVNVMPVTVGVEADQSAFQLYKSGIVSSNCGASLNHAITVVGYATSGSTDYWNVKNSWGTSWGESGYIRIARGTQNSGKGVCGINSMASYPTL